MRHTPQPGPAYAGITIQDDGLGKRELALLITASSTLIVSVAIAVAIWRLSIGLMWGMIILSVGCAGQMLLVGAGIYIRHRLTGEALVIEARGKAQAMIYQARERLWLSARIQTGEDRP